MLLNLFCNVMQPPLNENELLNENKNSAPVHSCTSIDPSSVFFSSESFIHACEMPRVAEIYYQGELARAM